MASMHWPVASTSDGERQPSAGSPRKRSPSKKHRMARGKENPDTAMDLSTTRRSSKVLGEVVNNARVPSPGPSNPKPTKRPFDIETILATPFVNTERRENPYTLHFPRPPTPSFPICRDYSPQPSPPWFGSPVLQPPGHVFSPSFRYSYSLQYQSWSQPNPLPSWPQHRYSPQGSPPLSYAVPLFAPQPFQGHPAVYPTSSSQSPATAESPKAAVPKAELPPAAEDTASDAASTQSSPETEGQRKRKRNPPQRIKKRPKENPEEKSRLKELMKTYCYIECRATDDYIKTRPDTDRDFYAQREEEIRIRMIQDEGGSTFSCLKCKDCKGKSRNKVRQHVAGIHIPKKLRKYTCPCPTLNGKCEHYFEDPFDLLRHEHVHTNVRPYPCPNPNGCPIEFVSTQPVTIEKHLEKCFPSLNFKNLKKVSGKINICPICPTYSVPGHPKKFIQHMLRFHPQTNMVRKSFKDGRRIKLGNLTPAQRDDLDLSCRQALETRQNVPPEEIHDGNGWEHVIALLSGEDWGLSPEDKAWVAAAEERAAAKGIVLVKPSASSSS